MLEYAGIILIIIVLKEEIEAIDWYNQRVVATNDEELKAIMAHNRDEEIEHRLMEVFKIYLSARKVVRVEVPKGLEYI